MSELDRLARRLQALESTVRALGGVPQLAQSSIMDGAVDQVTSVPAGTDVEGNVLYTAQVVSRYGQQTDGSNTMVSFTGPKPPTPVGFTVTPGVGFLAVEWEGEFSDRIEPYLDHDHVAVHVGVTSGFTPIAATLKATIRARQGETVTVALEPGTYFVTLVAVSQAGVWGDPAPYTSGEPGSAASGVDVTARAMADAAYALADGKSKVYYSENLPAGTVVTDTAGVATVEPAAGHGYKNGDVWYRLGPAPGRSLLDVLVFDSTAGLWRAKLLDNQAVGSLSAAKLTTGTLDAATSITVGTEAPVVIGDSSLTVLRNNPDGVPVPTIRVGGMLGDNLIIIDPATGATKAGFNTDGDGVARSFAVDELVVDGLSLGEILRPMPRGLVAGFRCVVTRPAITTTQYGLFEVAATLQRGRTYLLTFVGNFTHGTASGAMRLWLRSTTDGSPPLTTSTQLMMGWFGFPAVANLPVQCRIGTHFHVGTDVSQPPVEFRALVSAATLAGTAAFYPDSGVTPGFFLIEDVGVLEGDFMIDGSASGGDPGSPPPPVGTQTYVKLYGSSWTRTWQGGTSAGDVRTDTTDAVQGYSSGWQNWAQIGFPTSVYTDLNGSQVQKIEVYLYAYHWWSSSGGTALIGTHGNITAPASFTYSGSVASTGWPRGAGRWITLPEAWHAGFASGANRGVTLGGGASTSTVYYGRFYGTGATSKKPAIRITYVK